MNRSSAWWNDGRLRLAVLLALLAALLAYVVTTRTGALGVTTGALGTPSGGAVVGARTPTDCPAAGAPSVESVSRPTLRGLREDLRGVMFGRGRRLYEEGLAASGFAWSDSEPGKRLALPPNARDPGGYELRWWAANGDDVAADVFLFAGVGQARDFFDRASSARCRPSGTALAASSPPGGRDLAWRNPDGFAQEDVYLLRGRRVYRVGVVRAGAGNGITSAGRSAAFALVNGLACALPGVWCHPQSDQALAQQALAEQLALVRRQLPGGQPRAGATAGEGPGACSSTTGARDGETGAALSESLYYGNGLALRVAIHLYASDAAARRALPRYATRAARGCLAGRLASALRARRSRAGTPRERLASAPIGQGALVAEVEVPFSYAGRPYALVLDGVIVRQGRIIDVLSTLAPATTIRAAERLATQLARLAVGEQR
ncbi:MAG TPA: hypothetical protein VK252_03275 [Solirubrobacteraceae bacterium]|nr:hypothetical protein [Solirubrobacteraceae bacterium]